MLSNAASGGRALTSVTTARATISKVGTDLFEWDKKIYLVIDYYSRFIEIAQLTGSSSAEVVRHTKSIFARHGIPEVVVSDNGPQYTSSTYAEFAREYCFNHVTSSPLYPPGNGEAERGAKTVKQLLRKREDPYLALLAYRATPLQCGFSPAELLMSWRRLRTTVQPWNDPPQILTRLSNLRNRPIGPRETGPHQTALTPAGTERREM